MYVWSDLQWVWLALVSMMWLWRVHPELAIRGAGSRRTQRLLPLGLAVTLAATAIVSTPHLRFSGALHGDEPKYLRYCENFYQGLGFDVAMKRPLTSPGAAAPNARANWQHVRRALAEEARLAAHDLRRLVGFPAPPRLIAGEPSPGMFFAGKHPGSIYQLHNPGLSFLLFPSYYVDRRWTGSGVGYQEEFPASMPALNGMLLAMYVGYGLSISMLLRSRGHHPLLAGSMAAIVSIALPAGAFAFQIYPELAAGIVVAMLLSRLMSSGVATPSGDLAVGLLAGFLPWLHIRLGLVTAVAMIWRAADRRQSRLVRWCFAAGALVGLVSLALYTYRLTGSPLPISTYGADTPLSLMRIATGLPGFAFDRDYGLLPHAPIHLFTLLGLGTLWRRARGPCVLVGLMTLAIAVPAAGHGYWAGGATPARYLVAALPALAIPLTQAVTTLWSRRAVRAATVILIGLSLEAATTYNLSHHKEVGPLVTPGFSGWRLNLLFPAIGQGEAITGPDAVLLSGWIAVALSLVLIPAATDWFRRSHPGPTLDGPGEGHRWLVVDAFAGLLGLSLLGAVVSASTGVSASSTYLVSRHDAHGAALRKFAELPQCALCYSSRLGQVAPTAALGNDPDFIQILTEPARPAAGHPVRFRARPRSTIGEFMVGDVLLELGDGTHVQERRMFGDLEVQHTYTQAGVFAVRATFRSTEGRSVTAMLPLTVGAGP